MAFDVGARVEHLDIGQIPNDPAGVDEPPAQLDFLVAVEEVGEVSADLFVRTPPNRTGAAEKQRHVARPVRVFAAEPRDVSASGLAVLVHEPQSDRAQVRIVLKGELDSLGIATQFGVVVEEADDRRVTSTHTQVAPARDPEILRKGQQVDAVVDGQIGGAVRHDEARSGGQRPCRLGERSRSVTHRQNHPSDGRVVLRRRLVHGSNLLPGATRRRGRASSGHLTLDTLVAMSAPVVAREGAQLRDAHESAKLIPYLRELWERRSYIRHVAMNELRHRQITNVLGSFWHLLNPALTIGVYYIIFGVVIKSDRGVPNFLLFITIGLFVFQFGQKSTIDGSRSIINNKGLIKAVRFPRALLPISATLTEALASIPTFVVAYVVALASGTDITWRWLMLPPLLILMTLFNIGTAMVAARLTTHFADTTQILPFVFRLALYLSGVIFSVDALVDNPLANTLFTLNPYYCFISLARWSIMAGNLQSDLLFSAFAWTAVSLIGGFLWFRAAEERYARD